MTMPKTDTDRLARLVADIEAMKDTRLTELLHRLETEEGMKMRFSAGAHEVRLAGIRSSGTAGEREALTNWAMAARRRLIAEGAP